MFSLINQNSKIRGTRFDEPSAFSLIFFLVGTLIINGHADGKYPDQVREVQIKSSVDGTLQKALFFAPESEKEVPLLVALHTWSSGWQNTYNVPLAEGCIERQWAFIHPDFRGPNKRPDACGSDLAVSDIIDAVKWAKEKTGIDMDRIYLAGASGGGHMALQMAGRAPDIWAGVSSWVPITDCAAWHAECKRSGRRYYKDLEVSCKGKPGDNSEVDLEYSKRSPLTWLSKASNVPLDINAGIRDGHEGSVPISHSLKAFNLLADSSLKLTQEQIDRFTKESKVPESLKGAGPDPSYGKDRQPLWRGQSKATRVTIFNGGHEMIPSAIFDWLAKQKKP